MFEDLAKDLTDFKQVCECSADFQAHPQCDGNICFAQQRAILGALQDAARSRADLMDSLKYCIENIQGIMDGDDIPSTVILRRAKTVLANAKMLTGPEPPIDRIPASLYWMMAKGRTRPIEPLYAVQLIDAESGVAIAEAEAETLPEAIDAAIAKLPVTSSAPSPERSA